MTEVSADAAVQRERDGRRVRPSAVVAVLALAGMTASFMQTILIPIQGELPELLDASRSDTAWVITITLLVSAICTPIFGKLGDMFGKRRVALVLLGMLVLGSITAEQYVTERSKMKKTYCFTFTSVFSHPVRIKLLAFIAANPATRTEIMAREIGEPRSSLGRHLRILKFIPSLPATSPMNIERDDLADGQRKSPDCARFSLHLTRLDPRSDINLFG